MTADRLARLRADLAHARAHGGGVVSVRAADLAFALESLDAAQQLLTSFARRIVQDGPPQNGDWACVECRPHSDMLLPGFRCAYHVAADLLPAAHPALDPEPESGATSDPCATSPPS